MKKLDSLERSPSLPVGKDDKKNTEERRNTMPANSRDQSFDVKSATISHQIPHQLQKNTLITPTPCGYCHKFIWGLLKEAYTCFECDQHWHPNCKIFIQNDCGLTLRMLSSLVLLNDKGGSLKAKSAPTIEKKEIGEKEPKDQQLKTEKEPSEKETKDQKESKESKENKESKESKDQKSDSKKIFEDHNLQPFTIKVPTWCKVCKSFIWTGNQAFRCQKCQLECHSKCVPQIEVDCLKIAGGQLTFSDSKLDDQSTNIIRERRTSSHPAKQATFKKNKGRFALNFSKPKKNGSTFHQSNLSKSGSKQEISDPSSESEEEASEEISEDEVAKQREARKEEQIKIEKEREEKEQKEKELKEKELKEKKKEKELKESKEKEKEKIKEKELKEKELKEKELKEKEKTKKPDSLAIPSTNNESETSPRPQARFEDFIIENHVLGSGQFGVVKLGKHTLTNSMLAVKIIDKRKFWGRKDSERHLQREIEIMSSVRHPNIIQLYAVFDRPSELYLFMELVEGGDLLSYVEQKGHINEDEAKFLFHQLCVGVKYLHDAGIMHRDLKPENLLLSEEDGVKRLKIADFGFANIIGKKSFLQSVVGTPAYVAPEILKKDKGYQKSADLWSIGVILYACLSGVFPFDEDEPVEDQIKAGKFNFPDDYWGHVSDEAIDLCCNLLVVDPRQRYTIDDVLKHLWFSTKKQLQL